MIADDAGVSMSNGAFFPAVAACVLWIACLYAAPQIRYSLAGHSGAVILQEDEPWYGARLARVVQGRLWIGNPWLYEHRDDPNTIPPLQEAFLAAVGKPLRLSVDQLMILARPLLGASAFLALLWAILSLGASRALALFLALWILSDPALLGYKPLGAWYLGNFRQMLFNRFLNPLFGLPLFFLAWGAGAKAFLAPRFDARRTVPAGFLLGSLFYVSIFYWSHLVVAYMLAAILFLRGHGGKTLATIGVVALAVSFPYWIMTAHLHQHPLFKDVTWRWALMLKDRGWYLLPHKTLWIFAAAAATLLFTDDPGARFLALSGLGGMACYFSSVVTGVSLQNFHWNYTLAPMLYAGALWAASRFLARRHPSPKILRAGRISAVAMLLATMASGLRAGLHVPPISATDQGYEQAWTWLKTNAPSDSVILVDERTLGFVPFRTGSRIWVDSHLTVELVSFPETLERYQILWALEGLKGDALERHLLPPDPLVVPHWCVGLSPRLLKELDKKGRPPFDAAVDTWLAGELAREQDALSPEDLARLGRKYRADFLVRGPNEAGWPDAADRLLRLKPAAVMGGVHIDRIEGWN